MTQLPWTHLQAFSFWILIFTIWVRSSLFQFSYTQAMIYFAGVSSKKKLEKEFLSSKNHCSLRRYVQHATGQGKKKCSFGQACFLQMALNYGTLMLEWWKLKNKEVICSILDPCPSWSGLFVHTFWFTWSNWRPV